MATTTVTLPEGTDSIVPGASVLGEDETMTAAQTGPKGKVAKAAAKVGEKTAGVRAKAADKARDYAVQGKDKATSALDGVVKLVDDAAGTLDDKVGEQYGAYARKASEAIAGVASTLRSKDVDELFADAREAVKNNPAIAIGAAAAIGFVIARVIKSASDSTDSDRDAGA